MILVAVAVGGYLIGTISFARLIARLALPGEDISSTEYPDEESGEVWVYEGVSATSVLERAGFKWGLVVIIADAAKAFVPTLLLRQSDVHDWAFAVVAVAVMAGHVWPVWWKFEGGRGQAVLLGALLAIDPLAVLVGALGGAVVGLAVFTSVYAARNMGPLLLVPWFALTGSGPEMLFGVGAALIYSIASSPDVAQELKVRRGRGVHQLSYPERLRRAWSEFFTDD